MNNARRLITAATFAVATMLVPIVVSASPIPGPNDPYYDAPDVTHLVITAGNCHDSTTRLTGISHITGQAIMLDRLTGERMDSQPVVDSQRFTLMAGQVFGTVGLYEAYVVSPSNTNSTHAITEQPLRVSLPTPEECLRQYQQPQR